MNYHSPDIFTFGSSYYVLDISLIAANGKTIIQVLDNSNNRKWINYLYFDDIHVIREKKLNRIIDDE